MQLTSDSDYRTWKETFSKNHLSALTQTSQKFIKVSGFFTIIFDFSTFFLIA